MAAQAQVTNHEVDAQKPRPTMKEIAETTSTSEERVGHMLYEILGMKKLSAQWVPRLLTPEQKRNRVTISEQSGQDAMQS